MGLRVSVIIPTRNEEARIAACLRAVLSQDYPQNRYEVVVVDDMSTDRTAEVAASFGVRVLRCTGPLALGGAAARNLGVAATQGEVVAFTDADCIPARSWLQQLVFPFRDKEVGVCGGDVVGVGRSLVARYVESSGIFRLESRQRSKPWPVFVTANVAYRRAVFEALGGFDPSLKGATDLEMAWRVARDGRFRLVCCPGALVYHRHPNTVRGLYEQWRGYGAGRSRLVAKMGGRRAVLRDGFFQTGIALNASLMAPLRALQRTGALGREGWEYPVFPFLDVVRALAFAVGYWQAVFGRAPKASWRERAGEGKRLRSTRAASGEAP